MLRTNDPERVAVARCDALTDALADLARQYELPVDAEVCPPAMVHAQRDLYRAQQALWVLARARGIAPPRQVVVNNLITIAAPAARRVPVQRAAPPSGVQDAVVRGLIGATIVVIVVYCAVMLALASGH